MAIGLKPSYIVVDPATPRGKYQICRLNIGGNYGVLAECRNQTSAKMIVEALNNDEFTSRIVVSIREDRKLREAAE